MAPFTILARLFMAPSLWHFLIHTRGMMALTTYTTQMTKDRPLPLLQTRGNLPRVLWIIMPVIDGTIHHSCSPVRGPFIMAFSYPQLQHDGIDHLHHSDDRGSPFATLTDQGKFAKGTVDYNASYRWRHSPFLLTCSWPLHYGIFLSTIAA